MKFKFVIVNEQLDLCKNEKEYIKNKIRVEIFDNVKINDRLQDKIDELLKHKTKLFKELD